MSKLLRISPELAIPDDVVTATSVVYGGKGMGKTNLASVLVEEATKARLRWAVLDPMGVFWGLRHSVDGKGLGIECVILGGPHGDIPIEPTSGEIVADLVIDEGVNTVIDFSRKASGEMWGKKEKVRFVTDYALRLFRRQGDLLPGNQRREPLLQILDEAARYIPQVIPHGSFDLAECVGAWEQVAEEGRNIGLGIAFLTQRSARMNKSVSELADVMFAFRTIGPNSLAAVMDWLGEHIEKSRIREVAGQVRELDVGQALVVSPGWLRVEKVVKIRARETFDSSATPKPGQRAHKVTGQAAKPDLAKYRERMASTIEKAKADDPKELKKKIAQLEGDLRKVSKQNTQSTTAKPAVDHSLIEKAVARVLADERKLLRPILDRLQRIALGVTNLPAIVGELAVVINDAKPGVLLAPVERRPNPSSPVVSRSGSSPERRAGGHAGRDSRERPATPSDGSVSRSQQKILDALAAFEQLGISPAKRVNVAFFAGYTENGHFNNMVGELRTNGYLDYPAGNMVQLTDSGRAIANAAANEIQTLEDLHNTWLRKLSPSEGKLLRVLIDRGVDNPISRADLAAETGYTENGHFNNMVGHLRTLGAADYPGGGMVVATDVLFPAGLS